MLANRIMQKTLASVLKDFDDEFTFCANQAIIIEGRKESGILFGDYFFRLIYDASIYEEHSFKMHNDVSWVMDDPSRLEAVLIQRLDHLVYKNTICESIINVKCIQNPERTEERIAKITMLLSIKIEYLHELKEFLSAKNDGQMQITGTYFSLD